MTIRDELETLFASRVHILAGVAATVVVDERARARAEERAAVVRWLRTYPAAVRASGVVGCMDVIEAADAIYRGAHREGHEK